MKELVQIQNRLKAPKSQYNAFGKYSYRNLEDILEAVKPLLLEYNCTLRLIDDLVLIGDRYYIKATAFLQNSENEIVEAWAYARESLDKKGMDDSQITGATSSYARKYAVNGLFLIDDTKDADNFDNTKTGNSEVKFTPKSTFTKKSDFKMSDGQRRALYAIAKDKGFVISDEFINIEGKNYNYKEWGFSEIDRFIKKYGTIKEPTQEVPSNEVLESPQEDDFWSDVKKEIENED